MCAVPASPGIVVLLISYYFLNNKKKRKKSGTLFVCAPVREMVLHFQVRGYCMHIITSPARSRSRLCCELGILKYSHDVSLSSKVIEGEDFSKN